MAANDHRSAAPQTLRELLDARRRQLTDDLQLRVARIREHGSCASFAKEPDDRDPCDLDVALVDIATATLRRIDQAIERLNGGSCGLCARCGGPIGEARLQAMPFAVCCQRCESAREREVTAGRVSARKRVWAEWQSQDRPLLDRQP